MLGPLPDIPFVSVFGLTYNHEDFVAEAIESVLAQGWPEDRFEYVLLDDGSTDATPERAAAYTERITYIRQENEGINAAVNRVISLLQGDVFVACSGDDMWPEGKLERVIERLKARPDVGLLYGDMEVIDDSGKVIAPSFTRASNIEPHTGQIAGKLLAGNFVSAGGMAMRAELRPVMHPVPEVAAWEDWWWAWALANVTPVDYIDEPVYRYRYHGENFVLGLRDQAKMAERLAAEIPFRRYLLGAVRPGTATLADLGRGAAQLYRSLTHLAAQGHEAVTVTGAERATAETLVTRARAVASQSTAVAGFAAARAVAADPTNVRALELLGELAGTDDSTPPELFDGVRTIRVVADAEELVAEPELLAGYASAFGSGDDITLLALTRTWDYERLGAELAPHAALFEGADPPDVLASPCTDVDWLNAYTRADCVLSARGEPIPGVAQYGDISELRAFVDHRLRFPAFTA
jgi:glycosyltransferase involved in cell wall biosynthesis